MLFVNDSQRRAVFARMSQFSKDPRKPIVLKSEYGVAMFKPEFIENMSKPIERVEKKHVDLVAMIRAEGKEPDNLDEMIRKAKKTEFARKVPGLSKQMIAVFDKYGVAYDIDGVDDILLMDVSREEKLRKLENFCRGQVSTQKTYDVDRDTRESWQRQYMDDIAERFVGGLIDESNPDVARMKRKQYFKDRVAELGSKASAYTFDNKLALAEKAAKGDIGLEELDVYKLFMATSPEFKSIVKDFYAGKSAEDIKDKLSDHLKDIVQEAPAEQVVSQEPDEQVFVEVPKNIPVVSRSFEFEFPEQKPEITYDYDMKVAS